MRLHNGQPSERLCLLFPTVERSVESWGSRGLSHTVNHGKGDLEWIVMSEEGEASESLSNSLRVCWESALPGCCSPVYKTGASAVVLHHSHAFPQRGPEHWPLMGISRRAFKYRWPEARNSDSISFTRWQLGDKELAVAGQPGCLAGSSHSSFTHSPIWTIKCSLRLSLVFGRQRLPSDLKN